MTAPADPDATAPDEEGRFTPARLTEVLAAVCAAAGLHHSGAKLLKFTANAVFRLREPVVVRIAGSTALSHRAAKVVRVANWLAGHDVPAVRLLPGVPQPVYVGPYQATLWQAVPSGRHRPSAADLARLLKQLHGLPLPTFDLPSWEPLDDVRRRLGDAEGLDPADRRFLEDRCAQLAERLATLDYPLTRCVVHGDAHLGNLIPSPQGPVLCDFDSTCLGPPEWDLTPIPVGLRRFGGSRRAARSFVREYGFDVTTWPGFAVLREVRELKLATSVLPILRSNPGVAPELRRRLDSVRTGDTTAGWSRYG
ncbi:MAG TPA: aminoglycoside phosphotransferase family protein [Pseudonocardiaceae bacterium]|nr:aminoglycoside phosphotransferase family protein [Pseudonocardiaceae bacterium]